MTQRRRRSSSMSPSTTIRSAARSRCHVTQFTAPAAAGVATRLTSPLFQQLVESRDAQFGALAGVQFAEGVVVKEPVVRTTLFRHGS